MTAPASTPGTVSTGEEIRLVAVSKAFAPRRREPVQAVEGVDLTVSAGRFVSLVGPSGCGKTTLLKMVAGLTTPSEGQISVGGTLVTGPLRHFGMAFQSPVLLPWRSALANVLLPIEMLRRDPREYTDRAGELLDKVGLGGSERLKLREMSGGMQMRVALCRALIHDPPVLLLDEPFSGVDELTRESLLDHLLTLWGASGKTVLLVTHDVDEAVYLSDRVVVLTRRPARVASIVEVSLPRPRAQEMRYLPEFIELTRSVREALRT